MATSNNIKPFTAADIEKYHRNQLSSKEMHELEKAALDDPFLADALEGYGVTGINTAADITELKNRLVKNIEERKIVPLFTRQRSTFLWLRVAVMLIALAGAGMLVYKLSFNKKSANIAKAEPKNSEEIKTTDTGHVSAPASIKKDTADTVTTGRQQKDIPVAGNGKIVQGKITTTQSGGRGLISSDSTVTAFRNFSTNPASSAPAKAADEKKNPVTLNEENSEKNVNTSPKKEIKSKATGDRKEMNEDLVINKPDQPTEGYNKINGAVVTNRQAQNQPGANYFRGRVTDRDNNPVPFANVTNFQGEVSTYTDAKGNFKLISSDSIINIRVKSLGFNSNNVQLKNNSTISQVILQEDKNLNELVISNKKTNAAARSLVANVKSEEPEPVDGWDNYDTYLMNNLNIPEEIKTKQTNSGEVVVSFKTNKNGDPSDIKVEKSLCVKCDEEAIRLIKEGPKWKRKTKNGRTMVTIHFPNLMK